MTMLEKFAKQNEILELQRAFLRGEIKEEELTQEQKESLEKLFDEQIVMINRENMMKKRKIISKLKKDKAFVLLFQKYRQGLLREEELDDVTKSRIQFVCEFAKAN